MPPVPEHDAVVDHPRSKRRRIEHSWAYEGGWRGISWNSQALMSADPSRQKRKRAYLARLLRSRPDFILLQELHSTPGALATWQPPAGYRLWVSHGTAASAGIGILVSETFLRQFEAATNDNWLQIVPGRIGCLRLQGNSGCVDIWCVYLTTGDAKDVRDKQLKALYPHLRPAAHALTIIGGDWNFAATAEDRGRLDQMVITSDTCTKGTKEQEQFLQNAESRDLFELEQHAFFHASQRDWYFTQ